MTDKSNVRIFGTILLFCLTVVAGCGPSLTVRHEDPLHPTVEIRIDQELVDVVAFGDEVSISVDRGIHLVEAWPPGTESNPWTEDGAGWLVFVDEGAVLFLFPTVRSPQ